MKAPQCREDLGVSSPKVDSASGVHGPSGQGRAKLVWNARTRWRRWAGSPSPVSALATAVRSHGTGSCIADSRCLSSPKSPSLRRVPRGEARQPRPSIQQAFVDPPTAAWMVTAFSNASRVGTRRGVRFTWTRWTACLPVPGRNATAWVQAGGTDVPGEPSTGAQRGGNCWCSSDGRACLLRSETRKGRHPPRSILKSVIPARGWD